MTKTKCSFCGKTVEGKLLGRLCLQCDRDNYEAALENAESA
jgi:hypothetical protein